MSTFTTRAALAIQANPAYFVWWYTLKSIALVIAASIASYYAGKSRGMLMAQGRWSQFS